MVDASNLGRVRMLYGEKSRIDQALTSLNAGEPIRSLKIGEVEISTVHLTYPPQMVQTIRNDLLGRLDEIKNELTDLGVTGLPPTQEEPK